MSKKGRKKAFKRLWKYAATLERPANSDFQCEGEVFLALQEFMSAHHTEHMQEDQPYTQAMGVELVYHLFYLLFRSGITYEQMAKSVDEFMDRDQEMNKRFRSKW